MDRAEGAFYGLCSDLRAQVNDLGEGRSPERVLTASVSPPGPPGTLPTAGTHLCIKAINKMIVLVILFQSSGLLAHPAAATVHFVVVTGGDGCVPSGPAHQLCQPRTQRLPRAPDVAIKGRCWAVC